MDLPKISVIVPVYCVRDFVGKCAESLLSQDMKEIEVLFINDCTKDDSVDIINDCIRKHPDFHGEVRVIHHERNKGLPAARNTGLMNAHGEYVFHCDGDDWLETNALSEMYKAAKSNEADYVWCDWFLSYENTERHMRQANYSSADDLVRNGLLGCGVKYNVWNKLVKRELYSQNNIVFPEGYSMGEDMTMIMLGACATSVAYCPIPLYHYIRLNSGAMTQSINDKKLSSIVYNVGRLETFIESHRPSLYKRELLWFKMNVKLPLLLEGDREMRRKWSELYPESNGVVFSNPNVSLRIRCLEWAASHNLWILVDLYKKLFEMINKLIFER